MAEAESHAGSTGNEVWWCTAEVRTVSHAAHTSTTAAVTQDAAPSLPFPHSKTKYKQKWQKNSSLCTEKMSENCIEKMYEKRF